MMSFSCETSRRRLIEALEAYTIIKSPYAYTVEQVAGAQKRQISHAQEMEAVRLTLLLRGAEDDEFYHELALVTPDQVIVEIHQAVLGIGFW